MHSLKELARSDIINSIIKKGYIGQGKRNLEAQYGCAEQALFYKHPDHQDVIIFPPSSDIDTQGIEPINEMLLAAKGSNLDGVTKMIFPVVEQQNILFFGPRKHWVTVFFDINTKNITVIDPRPAIINRWYPTSNMQDLFRSGITTHLNLELDEFRVVSLNKQFDNTSCGHWTLATIDHLILHGLSDLENISLPEVDENESEVDENESVGNSTTWSEVSSNQADDEFNQEIKDNLSINDTNHETLLQLFANNFSSYDAFVQNCMMILLAIFILCILVIIITCPPVAAALGIAGLVCSTIYLMAVVTAFVGMIGTFTLAMMSTEDQVNSNDYSFLNTEPSADGLGSLVFNG